MKGLIIKAILAVAILFGLSNYGLYLTTGKAPISGMKLVNPLSGVSVGDLAPELPKSKDTAYKWMDENGVVHYSSEAPSHLAETEKLEVDPNTNLILGLKSPPEEKAPASTQQQQPTLNNPYTAEGIQQTLDKARDVQRILDERHEAQKKLMGD